MEEEGQFDDAEVELIGFKMEQRKMIESSGEEIFSDEYSDEGYDGDYSVVRQAAGRVPGAGVQTANLKNFQPSEKMFKKFSNKINVDKYEGPALNLIQEQDKRIDKVRFIHSCENTFFIKNCWTRSGSNKSEEFWYFLKFFLWNSRKIEKQGFSWRDMDWILFLINCIR